MPYVFFPNSPLYFPFFLDFAQQRTGAPFYLIQLVFAWAMAEFAYTGSGAILRAIDGRIVSKKQRLLEFNLSSLVALIIRILVPILWGPAKIG